MTEAADIAAIGQHRIPEASGPLIWLVSSARVQRRQVAELEDLLTQDDGVVWVDIPTCDAEAVRLLSEVFGFHPRAIQECTQRNPIPKVHAYPGHVFVVLHAPEHGDRGHVHYLELDQFVGPRFLVTVHGPINPLLDPRIALDETTAVGERLDDGRLRPASAPELSIAVVSRLISRLQQHLEALTEDVWRLERTVTSGQLGDTEPFLEEMFRVRHGLLTVGTMALLNHEVYGRMAILRVFGDGPDQAALTDLVDQFERIAKMADGQKKYLQGVIEFYQTRTNTKMTIAAERLAVIAAVTLPVTALSSIVGMNVIVNAETEWGWLVLLLAVMATMSATMLLWAKRNGWW